MIKKSLIIFVNLVLIPLLIINRGFYFITEWLIKLKERQYIKRYKIDKYIKNNVIDVSFFLNEDGSATVEIKGNVINLSEKEVEIFLDIFTKLNKKIIFNGNFKENINRK